jgi:hypothetical protein
MSDARNSTTPLKGSFSVLGAFEIGVDVSLVLLGVLLIQIYYYFEHFSHDRRRVKTLVSVIM